MSACLIAVLLLVACGRSDPAPGPGSVTVGEARALDEAAEMFDVRPAPTASAAAAAASSAAER